MLATHSPYASNLQANYNILVPTPPPARSEARIWQYMSRSLQELEFHLDGNNSAMAALSDLKVLTIALLSPSARTNRELRFKLLKPLQAHLLLLPLQVRDAKTDPFALALLAYWYAVTMTLTPVRYAPVSQLTRSSCIKPTEAIYADLQKALADCVKEPSPRLEAAIKLMAIPMEIVQDMKEQLVKHQQNMCLPDTS